MPDKQVKSTSISITLPEQVIEIIDELIPLGLYGNKRAEVIRNLVLDQLKRLREKQGQ